MRKRVKDSPAKPDKVEYSAYNENYATVQYSLEEQINFVNLKIYEKEDETPYIHFRGKKYPVGYGVTKEYEDCLFNGVSKRLYYNNK